MCGIFCLVVMGELNVANAVKCLDKLVHRGPEAIHYVHFTVKNTEIFIGFTRLAIMDTSSRGMQPFDDNGNRVVCNGEIYNSQQLIAEYQLKVTSYCDCEVLLPLYKKVGFHRLIDMLDAEFALVLYDADQQMIYAARDRYGVRPLFCGYNDANRSIGFASELKALDELMDIVHPVQPNHYVTVDLARCNNFARHIYFDYQYSYPNKQRINHLLTNAVHKRLRADRNLGFLLSGGLDSSLIVAIASRILGPHNITCFTIGLPDSSDVIAAIKVAQFLGVRHHVVPFDIDEGFQSIPEVIRQIETYDITTIRASVPQYLMAKYINRNTDIKVLLSGEGSDEIHGSYRYFRDAPDVVSFHHESIRLLQELYMFDNLRTDRTMAAFGLEVRVPFLDHAYVDFITSINPELLMHYPDVMEKQLLRDSFNGYLPDELLYRKKEAFSDAVSSDHVNWFKSIQNRVEQLITDEELATNPFTRNKPMIKEALYYRRIFAQHYPHRDDVIPHYWLPKFQSLVVLDPSAILLQ